jgi:H+/Cl- antiporter ClcA
MAFSAALILKMALFAVPVALVAGGFSELTHRLAQWTRQRLSNPMVRAMAGGLAVIALVLIFRTTDYLNLGTDWMPKTLRAETTVPSYAFLLKLLFTVVTLGFGFKGGEVTTLFAIGALLGAALAPLFGLPPTFLGAIGYASVFAAAFLPPLAVTGFLAYVLVGHRGIYGARRLAVSKLDR